LTERPCTIALLHLAPEPGEVARNRQALEGALRKAAAQGARLIATPELALSGYGFRDRIGTAWIARGQEELFAWAGALAREARASLVLGAPEAEGASLFNSMIAFGPDGALVGQHRKVNALRVGSESWSTPGERATMLALPEIGRVGLFVCADMYSPRLVAETAALGCDLLLSSANWAPGEHGPSGEWERASRETSTPVLVCNRTGHDVLDFRGARSVVCKEGAITFAHDSPEAAIVLVDWTKEGQRLSNLRVIAADE
jgi:predicted amidohydrolase